VRIPPLNDPPVLRRVLVPVNDPYPKDSISRMSKLAIVESCKASGNKECGNVRQLSHINDA
jgi:hypothetical protein